MQMSDFFSHPFLPLALGDTVPNISFDRWYYPRIGAGQTLARSPGLGAVSCPLSEHLPVLQLVELCASSQAGRLGEMWWKPHCLVHEMWFTPPRYWILICYMCLFNSAFLFPFLRMKSRLFSAQSENRSVIKFSFSFSFEAFMPLKLIYMLHILNKVWSIVLTGFKHAEVLAPFPTQSPLTPQKGAATYTNTREVHAMQSIELAPYVLPQPLPYRYLMQ